MSEQSERLLKVILESELSYVELEKKTGIAKSSIQRYASGVTKKIPIDAVKLIADATGSSAAWIMGWSSNNVPLSSKFDNLPEPNITEDYTTFPVIGEVAAGYECVADENWLGETVDIPNNYLQGRNKSDFFVLKVKGDSMIPLYHEGDKVFILKQSTMDYSGQIGVVIYGDDKGTLKRVEYAQGEDWMKLVPLNLNHPVVKIENEGLEHCRVLGVPRLLIREIKD